MYAMRVFYFIIAVCISCFSMTLQAQQLDGESNTNRSLQFFGYMEGYYAHYSDQLPSGQFQKFPTSAPVSDAFGLNIAMVGMQYSSELTRYKFSFHAGDIPRSAWSNDYNAIQEAHVGLHLIPKLWLDAGYFRSHIGLESIQPRENIGTSLAMTSYFDPYFLSGAKLTYNIAPGYDLQLGAFNGYNSFIRVNDHKCYSLSLNRQQQSLFWSINSMVSNESQSTSLNKVRLYNDAYGTYTKDAFQLGFEANFGYQTHSNLKDSLQSAIMFSSTLSLKEQVKNGPIWLYQRLEWFDDQNELLTGPIENEQHDLVGVNSKGLTCGLEYKHTDQSYLRLEGRYLHLQPDETIFQQNGQYKSNRFEIISTLAAWF